MREMFCVPTTCECKSSIFFNYGRSGLSVPTTQPAVIEWQNNILTSIPPTKILGQKAESNHEGDSPSHQKVKQLIYHFLKLFTPHTLPQQESIQVECIPPTCQPYPIVSHVWGVGDEYYLPPGHTHSPDIPISLWTYSHLLEGTWYKR